MSFSFYRQLNAMDCGPTCLRMICKFYGRHFNVDSLRKRTGFGKAGVSLLGISEAAERLGFRTRAVQVNFDKLLSVPLPAILHWHHNHFVVLRSLTKRKATIADPDLGKISYSIKEFKDHWLSNEDGELGEVGTVLLLEPSPDFYSHENEKENKLSWEVIISYLRNNRRRLLLVITSLFITSCLQFILPFLTQSVVDIGIDSRNIGFITAVLFAQLTVTFSSTIVEFVRSRLQLKISNSINLSILSDFWIKLTRLPVAYFNSHHTGDILQRIGDNRQVQAFLTGQALYTIFESFNFIVYSIILVYYNIKVFVVFLFGSTIYISWILLFQRARRRINYETFRISSIENNATLQLVQGMQDIRLNNAEHLKRWEWENIQANAFKIMFKTLNYNQWQTTGALFINHGKDLIISYVVAHLVIEGQLTFGSMLAIQYIVGQLSGPISQFIGLSQGMQDAKISVERLNEIHRMEDEEPALAQLKTSLPESKDITFKNLSFTYPGAGDEAVLSNITLTIPEGKITAIVGISGSGKTTLLKILLKILEQYSGEITIADTDLKFISHSFWRSQCGAVLQDGFIFNDSVARNIAVGQENIDYERLLESSKIANIFDFIELLPNGFNTMLGAEGIGISQGQRQRILIARAVYKEPRYLFFDEATNALDANNESEIIRHLNEFFDGRTVVVVAHRLSTVKNAHKIIVLDKGQIAEEGTHSELTSLRGKYYELVKNQLELEI